MATTIRPETLKSNPYWIEKHRYYELKHFCLQYPIWKDAYQAADGLSKNPNGTVFIRTTGHGDPTARCAEARIFYRDRMDMVRRVAAETDMGLADYILEAVTYGYSYDNLKARLEIPCCKEFYYKLYRRFFWLLDQERG